MRTLTKHNINSYRKLLELHHQTYEDLTNSNVLRAIRRGRSSCTYLEKPCPRDHIHQFEEKPQKECFQFNRYNFTRSPIKFYKSFDYFDGFKLHLDLSDTYIWSENHELMSDMKGIYVMVNPYGNLHKQYERESEKILATPGSFVTIKITERNVRQTSAFLL